MRGAVTFNELINMPVKKYLILKRACEIESTASRISRIYDFNRGFNDPKPLLNQLNKELDQYLSKNVKGGKPSIDWKQKDPDWQSKLNALRV
jgi:hypothetical protein